MFQFPQYPLRACGSPSIRPPGARLCGAPLTRPSGTLSPRGRGGPARVRALSPPSPLGEKMAVGQMRGRRRASHLSVLTILTAVAVAAPSAAADDKSAPDYAKQVAPIFKKYCAGCHNDEDREGKFSLESYASLQRGTAHGPALLPGDPKASRMIRVLTGAAKPSMPPEDEPRPTSPEIALIAAWIESGARGPQGEEPDRLTLVVPKVLAHSKTRPIAAMDATRDGRWLAVARGNEVGLYGAKTPRGGAPSAP